MADYRGKKREGGGVCHMEKEDKERHSWQERQVGTTIEV